MIPQQPPQPPPGQGPIDPRGAFTPPPPPGGMPPSQWQRPTGPPPPPFGQMGQMFSPPMYMPPPPPKGGGFARAILMTLATTIFGLSLALNFYLLLASGVMSGGSSKETTLVDGDINQKIAIVPVSGTIMEDASTKFDRLLTSVEKDAGVKAVVIEVDSPGGSVTASDEIHQRILRYKADHPGTPVVISMAGLAASGGYYVSCAGDHLFAQPTTLTGNIGVLMPQFNVHELFEKWGVKETTIASTGATFKNAGSMFRPESPEERAYIQDIADKAFVLFKDVVAKGRQGKLTKPLPEIANGKIFMAADAKTLGLVDDIGYLPDAYEYAAKKAGLNRKMVVRFRDPPSFFDAFSSKSNLASPNASSVTVNGVNINAADVRDLITPRLMYLWQGR